MEVTTLSGNGIADTIDGIGTAASFNRPNAISFYDNTLYIGEVSGHRIRQLDLGTSEVTTIAGSGTQGTSPNPVGLLAELDNPSALVADSSNLYVLDTNNYLAWKISRTFPHSVSVYMGCFSGPVIGSGIGSADLACDPGEGTFAYPRGITTDGISIFVTEYNHNLIRKID
ncbi:MAG: hypothetical protein K8R21_09045 [Leptospira sp.]|nr:hypothetical protein [Leptospira sp.]